jgi:hypothetical protein
MSLLPESHVAAADPSVCVVTAAAGDLLFYRRATSAIADWRCQRPRRASCWSSLTTASWPPGTVPARSRKRQPAMLADRAVGGWQWRPTERSWRAGSRGQPPLQHERPRPARAGWQPTLAFAPTSSRSRAWPPGSTTPTWSTSTLDIKPGSSARMVDLGIGRRKPVTGRSRPAAHRHAPAGVPTTPMRRSRCRRTSIRAGRRRSSARPWP